MDSVRIASEAAGLLRASPSVLALLSVAVVAPAHAQESSPLESTLVEGAWSLAMALPNGGGTTLGLWKMVGERTNLGLQLSYSLFDRRQESDDDSRSADDTSWNLTLEPTIQRYFRVAENVAPFWTTGVSVGVGHSHARRERGTEIFESVQTSWILGAALGVGVDWFPLPDISIGGHTGFRTRFTDFDLDATGPDASGDDIRVNSFVSSLLLRIYF